MNQIDDGGPAFPVGDQSLHPLLIGMSLRDYFAAQAMPLVKGGWTSESAEACYEIADYMIAARKPQPGEEVKP